MGNQGSSQAGAIVAINQSKSERKVKQALGQVKGFRMEVGRDASERERKHHQRDDAHMWQELHHNLDALWKERVVDGFDKAIDDVLDLGGCAPTKSSKESFPPAADAAAAAPHAQGIESEAFAHRRKEHMEHHKFKVGRRSHGIVQQKSARVGRDSGESCSSGGTCSASEEPAKKPVIRHAKSVAREMIEEVKAREQRTRAGEESEYRRLTRVRRRTQAFVAKLSIKIPRDVEETSNEGKQTTPPVTGG